MRIVFLVVLLAGSVYYSYLAFADLGFMTRTGRLGPGFFPRIIGLAMCAFVIWSLIDAMRVQTDGNRDTATWRDAVLLMALAIGYAVLLRLFGGFVATVIYLAFALSILNGGKHIQNAILSILLPTGIYLLFDKLLNASMPPGLYDLPI